jgi:drug/metabolite transporter (DMT)-like permease
VLDKVVRTDYLPSSVLLLTYRALAAALIAATIVAVHELAWFAPRETALVLGIGALAPLAELPYYRALATEEATRVGPLLCLAPLATLLLATVVLGERLTPAQLAAFGLLLAGGSIVGLRRDGGRIALRAALPLLLLAAIPDAVGDVAFKFVASREEFWTTMAYQSLGIALGTLPIALVAWRRGDLGHAAPGPRGWALFGLSTALLYAGGFVQRYALTLAPVALVAALLGVQPLLVLLYAGVLARWLPRLRAEELSGAPLYLKLGAIGLLFAGGLLLQL